MPAARILYLSLVLGSALISSASVNSPGGRCGRSNASPNVFDSTSAIKKVPLKTYVAKGKPTRLITIGEDSRKGSTFIADFDHACILTEPSRRVLFVSNESLAGLVLQQGEWGPWPRFLPFSTAPLSNLSHFFTDGLAPLEDTPVLELFYRLRYSLKNAFHSFAEIGGFASLYELLQTIEASDLHLLLSQNELAGSRSFFGTALSSMCGNCTIHVPPRGNQGRSLVCYRRALMRVSHEVAARIRGSARDQMLAFRFSPAEAWARTISIPPVNVKAGQQPRIVIIERLNSRRILNLGFVEKVLRQRGWGVTTVHLECLTVTEQFRAIRNATTLLGAHGAGLSWGRFLPTNATLIQLVGFPCAYESHSNMHVHNPYGILPADARATSMFYNTSSATIFCDLMERKRRGAQDSSFTSGENATIQERPLDVREYDVVVDIPRLVEFISTADVTAAAWTAGAAAAVKA